MNKLFGTSKPKPAPEPATNINAPTLGETSGKVSLKLWNDNLTFYKYSWTKEQR